ARGGVVVRQGGRARLEVLLVRRQDRVAVLVHLGLPVRVEHRHPEVLADQLRADEPAVDLHLLPIGVAGERHLRDAGDHERVCEPAQKGDHDDGDDGCDEVAPHQKSWVVRPWMTGPRRSAGKNVSAPTRMITPIRSATNVGVSVRMVPGPAGWTFFSTRAPATASTRMIGAKRANTIVRPPMMLARCIPWEPRLPGFGWMKPV